MKRKLPLLTTLLPALALSAIATTAAAQATPKADAAQAWPPAASVPALQVRMKAIREATDPARRMALMEEQIQALEAASAAAPGACPMMGGAMPGGPMMGAPMRGGRGAGVGPGRAAAPGAGPGSPMRSMMIDPDTMREHMLMMEQHMKMMQRMIDMQKAMPAPAK